MSSLIRSLIFTLRDHWDAFIIITITIIIIINIIIIIIIIIILPSGSKGSSRVEVLHRQM